MSRAILQQLSVFPRLQLCLLRGAELAGAVAEYHHRSLHNQAHHAVRGHNAKETALGANYLRQDHTEFRVPAYNELYPPSVFNSLRASLASKPHLSAVDLDRTAGVTAVELARRQFRVTGLEPDVHCLAQAQLRAGLSGVSVQLVSASNATAAVHDGQADLVTMMFGEDDEDPSSTGLLRQAHRMLHPGGYAAVAWNDRVLSNPFIAELEDLLEAADPSYHRESSQHTPEYWNHVLADGKMFELHSYSVHPNPVRFSNTAALLQTLLQLIDSGAGASGQDTEALRRVQHAKLRDLVDRHFGQRTSPQLPLETRLFMLRRL